VKELIFNYKRFKMEYVLNSGNKFFRMSITLLALLCIGWILLQNSSPDFDFDLPEDGFADPELVELPDDGPDPEGDGKGRFELDPEVYVLLGVLATEIGYQLDDMITNLQNPAGVDDESDDPTQWGRKKLEKEITRLDGSIDERTLVQQLRAVLELKYPETKWKDIYETTLVDLGITVRLYNLLMFQECETLLDAKRVFDRLGSREKIKGFAKGSITELRSLLENAVKYGITRGGMVFENTWKEKPENIEIYDLGLEPGAAQKLRSAGVDFYGDLKILYDHIESGKMVVGIGKIVLSEIVRVIQEIEYTGQSKKILIVEDDYDWQVTIAAAVLAGVMGDYSGDAIIDSKAFEIEYLLDGNAHEKKDALNNLAKSFGFEFLFAHSQKDAEELLRNHTFSLITLDGSLYPGHGSNLLPLIKDHSKVLLCSGDNHSAFSHIDHTAEAIGKSGGSPRALNAIAKAAKKRLVE
jgi:hypothetical protein